MSTNKTKIFAKSNNEEPIKKASNNSLIVLMLEVYKSVLDNDGIFYCSAPVTSGKRYINWLERIDKKFIDIDEADEKCREFHYKEVIEPNRKYANLIIQKLRHKTCRVVIDPTALPHIPNWTQQDWRFFWQQVIERYVTTVFFIDDWQYSNGCVYEFWVSHRKGIPVFDENQQPLSIEKGTILIQEAICKIRNRGGSTIFIEEILRDIEALSINLES